MDSEIVTTLIQILLGGGLVGIITAIIAWRKHNLDKRNSKIEHSQITVDIALKTLESVHTQYKEVQVRQVELEKDVKNLKVQFEEQKSLVSKLKDYIFYVFDNWDSIRHNTAPPELNEEVHTKIFKEDKE